MLRYFANIRTGLEKLVRLEISNSGFTGTAEELEVSADSLEIQQSREGRFGAMCSAGWRATVTSDTNFKFQPMLLEGDLDNVCQLFEDGALMFSGYLENGVAEEEYVAPPYDVSLTFNDGIKKLRGYFLDPTGMWDKGYFNFVELFRVCLSPIMQANQQGKKMLYINNSLYNDAFKQDTAWSCFEQIYLHASAFDGKRMSLYDLLDNLLKPHSCYVAQTNGDWYIERVKNKIHSGSVDYIAFDLTNSYNVVSNRGQVYRLGNLIYQLGNSIHELNETPTLSTEKEYGVQHINVDNTLRDSIFTNRYGNAKALSLSTSTYTHNGNTYTSFPTLAKNRGEKASYTWYYTQQITGRAAVGFAPIASKYGMAQGMELTHAAENSYMYHMFTQSPAHFPLGGKLKITIKVYVDIVQNAIEKQTWVSIPFEFLNLQYINSTSWPNGGKITYYQGSAGEPHLAELLPRYNGGTWGVQGVGFLFVNSEDDTGLFEKWYAGQAGELSIEIDCPNQLSYPSRQGVIFDMPYLMLFPSLFCDGSYAPTCDNSKIAKTAYGDIKVEVIDAEEMEDGYSIDKTTTGAYVAKREAPELAIKYWEGPPFIEKDYSTAAEAYKTFVNFTYKNLIYVPLWSDMVTTDANGNIIGVKLIDNSTVDIKVGNSLNYAWYDRLRPLDEYNKKGFLLEHIAQDSFDCYAQASRVFKGTLHATKRPTMRDSFTLKHLPGCTFVATSITHKIDEDEYELQLEEVKDRVITTELFLPRVVSQNVTN